MAGLAQIFGEAQDNDVPLSMNDMDMVSGGYLLYETEVEANGEEAVLAVENIRDYAAVYVGEKRYGELSDTHKELTLALPEGTHKLHTRLRETSPPCGNIKVTSPSGWTTMSLSSAWVKSSRGSSTS